MFRWPAIGALAVLGLAPLAALAEASSEVVFSHKRWEVRYVAFDDGTEACVAQVTQGSDSFSVWAQQDETLQLQFYSEAWDFGEGQTADLIVQIDRRAGWSLSNAELYLQSVLFVLPGDEDGWRFLREVMAGNTLHLQNDRGEGVMDYSLSGSSASIGALVTCYEGITRSSNPFQ